MVLDILETKEREKGKILTDSKTFFYLNDSTALKSIKELMLALEYIGDDEYTHHVTSDRNNFSLWIENIFNEPELALELVHATSRKKAIKVLSGYLGKQRRGLKRLFKKPKKKEVSKASKANRNQKISEVLETEGVSKTVTETSVPKEEEKVKKEKESKKEIKGSEKIVTGASSEKKELEYTTPEILPNIEILNVGWIKTGVPGFDDLITKGIPKGSSVLLCGGTGTGKTTFALQTLAWAAKNNKKCLYLTFEEDVERLMSHMKNYGWDPFALQKSGNLVIKKMDPFEISRSVEALLAKASGELLIDLEQIDNLIPRGFKPDRIVLDSLSAVSAAFAGKEEGYRIYIEQLFELFKKIGATSFLITEVEQSTTRYSRSGIEEFLADAVIVFYNLREKSIRTSATEIIKIRGTSHEKKIVPFKILSGQGIVVYPNEEAFT